MEHPNPGWPLGTVRQDPAIRRAVVATLRRSSVPLSLRQLREATGHSTSQITTAIRLLPDVVRVSVHGRDFYRLKKTPTPVPRGKTAPRKARKKD